MAKSARASTKKANHQRLKSRVFGPVEDARTERLSAKLLELASQPKKREDVVMEPQESSTEQNSAAPTAESKETEGMEVDQDASKSTSKPKSSRKGRIEKRRSSRKASIVFPKYKNGKRVGPKTKGRR